MQEGVSESSPSWVGKPALDTSLRKLVDDGCLVYEPLAGTTQLLSPLSSFVIELLEQQRPAPLSTAAIIRAVQTEEPDSSLTECTQAVNSALEALMSAGLIAPARPGS